MQYVFNNNSQSIGQRSKETRTYIGLLFFKV